MTTVADLARWLDRFAPRHLAESWDNVGLLWGDPKIEVTKVMTCLTVTDETAREAIDEGAQLIVSHHPVLFKAVKRVRADVRETGMLWHLGRAGVSILSPHTAFDNTVGGINDGLAARLGLAEISPLRRAESVPTSYKIVVFTPSEARSEILSAAFEAGAGRIGAYEECSFTIEGEGTFFGTEGAKPAIGESGRLESVRELRLEVICPQDKLDAVLGAIRARHPYEEPATDIYPLHTSPAQRPGAGRVGRLPNPTTLRPFVERVTSLLKAQGVQYAGDPGRRIETVAIVCGAGDDFLPDAARVGADVLLTGEARFHRALEAEALGVGLVIAGHHATERPGVEDLADRIQSEHPGLAVWASRTEHDPWRS